jgi:phospholipid transport system substrate-binding protein
VDEERVAVLYEAREKALEVSLHVRIGVLLDEQARRGVAHEQGRETAARPVLGKPAGDLRGDLDQTPPAGPHRDLADLLSHTLPVGQPGTRGKPARSPRCTEARFWYPAVGFEGERRVRTRASSGCSRALRSRGSAPAEASRALVLAAAGLAVLLLTGLQATAARGADGAAEAVIAGLHAGMLAVMRESGELDYQQRFDRLAPVLGNAYDFDFMARKSLGRAFDGLDPASQKRWLALFRTYTIANYAGRFRGYHGQRFETVDEEPGTQGTVLVRTRLIDPGTETVDLNYRLRDRDGWRIIDIYLKGTVSELALRRSDFTATLERSGFGSLVESLKAKIADLAAGRVS